MRNTFIKTAGTLLAFFGVIGFFGSSFMFILTVFGGNLFKDAGPNLIGLTLWSAVSFIFSVIEILIGLDLISANAKSWQRAMMFEIIYIITMEAILLYAFGMEFIRSFGFLGFLIMPAIIIALLLAGKPHTKVELKTAKKVKLKAVA